MYSMQSVYVRNNIEINIRSISKETVLSTFIIQEKLKFSVGNVYIRQNEIVLLLNLGLGGPIGSPDESLF